jgi:hypothetical protein
MTTTRAQHSAAEGIREPTVASVWQGAAGSSITDELLGWPPDLFALTDLVLEQAEVYRFVLSPRSVWKPPAPPRSVAVEMSREGISLLVIQRQLGHAGLAITSRYLRGIDSTEIIAAVNERPAPMVPADPRIAHRR